MSPTFQKPMHEAEWGHFFMSSDKDIPRGNGAALNISQIIKAVMSSAAEAELGALFIKAQLAVPIRITLIELGHPQLKTPMQTNNFTAQGVITNRITPKATQPMDMCFHWLRCRDAQGQFRYFWRPGPTNTADYDTQKRCLTQKTAVSRRGRFAFTCKRKAPRPTFRRKWTDCTTHRVAPAVADK